MPIKVKVRKSIDYFYELRLLLFSKLARQSRPNPKKLEDGVEAENMFYNIL